jgi:hypothetical protein
VEPQPPILVTGAHRSGTTWVGRALAAASHVAYISEPLNPLHRPGVFSANTSHWYTYVCTENQAEFVDAFSELLALRYHISAELRSLGSLHDVLRMTRDLGIFVGGSLSRKRILLKDPFAVLSIQWFATALHCRIVITVRHPAAFVSSLKRLGWGFDFQDLLNQPYLMRDQLEPFRSRMEKARTAGIVEQASLLWRIIYAGLEAVQHSLSGVYFVRHEDLSLDPVGGFEGLYGECGLEFDERSRRAVRRMSSAANPSELPPGDVHSVNLNSRANLENWRRRLSPAEIAVVRAATEEVAARYYPDVTWI